MKHKKHFQEVKDIYYEKELKGDILSTFPELINLKEDDGYYTYAFALYSLLIENYFKESLLRRVIDFLNRAFELGSHQTDDLFSIEIFSDISEYPKMRLKFNERLKGKALASFKVQCEFIENGYDK